MIKKVAENNNIVYLLDDKTIDFNVREHEFRCMLVLFKGSREKSYILIERGDVIYTDIDFEQIQTRLEQIKKSREVRFL